MLLASLFSSLAGVFTILLRNLEFMCRIKTSTLNTIDVGFCSCAAPNKFRAGQRVSLALGGTVLHSPGAARALVESGKASPIESAPNALSADAEVELSDWKSVHEAPTGARGADSLVALPAGGGGSVSAAHGIDMVNPLFVSNLNLRASSDDTEDDELDADVSAIREQVSRIETTLREHLDDSTRQHAADLAQLRAGARDQQAKVQQLELAKQRQDAELARLSEQIRALLASAVDGEKVSAPPPGRGSRISGGMH